MLLSIREASGIIQTYQLRRMSDDESRRVECEGQIAAQSDQNILANQHRAMPKYNPKSTAPEQIVATKILEIMQGVPLAEAWSVVKQPKPDNPTIKLGWTPELIRDVLAKRSCETTLKVVNDALGVLHESGRVSKSVGDFGFDTYELIGAR